MQEDKRIILYYLLLAVKETRVGQEIITMSLTPDTEKVIVYYKGGSEQEINVACDSGIAMIRDIVNQIES